MRAPRRSPRPAVLPVLGGRAAPDASAHAGPLRRRREARAGRTRSGRVGRQLERDHIVQGPARMVLEGVGRGTEHAAEVERFEHHDVLTRPSRPAPSHVERQPRSVHGRSRSGRRGVQYLDRWPMRRRELPGPSTGAAPPRSPPRRPRRSATGGSPRRFYALLLAREARLCIIGGRGVYFRGAPARYLGLLAATLGLHEEAVAHLEQALRTNTPRRHRLGPRGAR